MNDQTKLAFEFASELSKQLITLSTGILALTITFTKDIVGVAGKPIRLLLFSWVLYLVSIFFGIWSLMALTGSLAPLEIIDPKLEPAIDFNVRLPSSLQVITFIFSTALIIWFGWVSLKKGNVTKPDLLVESQEGEGSL
jgi:hypothetical protein